MKRTLISQEETSEEREPRIKSGGTGGSGTAGIAQPSSQQIPSPAVGNSQAVVGAGKGPYRLFQKELYNCESLYKFIQRTYTTF
jgi:hypothetical protein